MLGKLMKHEWKSTYKMCVAMILFIFGVTLVGCLSFQTPMWRSAFSNREMENITAFDLLGIFSLLFYVFALVGIMFGSVIYLGYRFYRSMYSEEGYLTHTLPVTSHQLLISKIVVGGLWLILFILLMFGSMTVLLSSLLSTAFSSITGGMNIFEFFNMHQSEIRRAVQGELGDIFGAVKLSSEIPMYVIMFIIGAFYSMILLAGAMTLGQLSSKHKVLMSIVSYFGLLFVGNILSSVLSMPVTIRNIVYYTEGNSVSMNFNSIISPSSLISLGINIVMMVVIYLMSSYIITRKLNLE